MLVAHIGAGHESPKCSGFPKKQEVMQNTDLEGALRVTIFALTEKSTFFQL